MADLWPWILIAILVVLQAQIWWVWRRYTRFRAAMGEFLDDYAESWQDERAWQDRWQSEVDRCFREVRRTRRQAVKGFRLIHWWRRNAENACRDLYDWRRRSNRLRDAARAALPRGENDERQV